MLTNLAGRRAYRAEYKEEVILAHTVVVNLCPNVLIYAMTMSEAHHWRFCERLLTFRKRRCKDLRLASVFVVGGLPNLAICYLGSRRHVF